MWLARWRHDPEADARAAWLDAAALLEARSRVDFKHVQDAHMSLVDTLSELRADFARRDYQLTNTLAQLSTVCTTLVDRIESDREERRELVQTITALAAAVIGRAEPPAGHLVGGSVFGDPDIRVDGRTEHDDAVPATIDLVAEVVDDVHDSNGEGRPDNAAVPAPGDEVRCRFGDRWVEGFEILEVHSREGRARCRVRRRSDGSVVRKLFEANDLEVVTASASAVS
jgi:hypothetical protein